MAKLTEVQEQVLAAFWSPLVAAADEVFPDADGEGLDRLDRRLQAAMQRGLDAAFAAVEDAYAARMRALAEYENTITWNTTCHGCAGRLDNLIAERHVGYEEGVRDAEARVRAEVAEEIARAIEVAQGDRCPTCGGKPASVKWTRGSYQKHGRCGAGHTWQKRGGDWRDPAEVARGHVGVTADPADRDESVDAG